MLLGRMRGIETTLLHGGIAIAALGKGYRVIFMVPTKFSAEKQSLMRALGAEVVNTPVKRECWAPRARRRNCAGRYPARFR